MINISWYASQGSIMQLVECGDFIKNKKYGLKQTNVP